MRRERRMPFFGPYGADPLSQADADDWCADLWAHWLDCEPVPAHLIASHTFCAVRALHFGLLADWERHHKRGREIAQESLEAA